MEDFCGNTFWDSNRTWYTENPDFTPCFENTILAWIPALFLLIFTPVDVYYTLQHSLIARVIFRSRPSSRSSSRSRSKVSISSITEPVFNSEVRDQTQSQNRARGHWTFFSISKYIICILLILCEIIYLIHNVAVKESDSGENSVDPVKIYTPIIKGCTYLIALGLLHFMRVKNVGSSAVQFFFWLILTICEVVIFRSNIMKFNMETDSSFIFAVPMVYFPLVLFQFILNCWADTKPRRKIKKIETTQAEMKHQSYNQIKRKEKNRQNPEFQRSFFSRLLASWIDPLVWKGFRKPLEFSDLWNLNIQDTSRHLVPNFEKAWKNCQLKRDEGKSMSIFPPLASTFGPLFTLACVLKFFPDMMVFISPEILNFMIGFVNDEEAPMWKGYLYASTLFFSGFCISIAYQQYGHMIWVIGMRIRTVLVSAVYKKALVLSNSSKKGSTTGEIVNLMSVDVQRVMDMISYIPLIWSTPLQVAVALYMLYGKLGSAVFVGIGVIVIFFPLNIYIAAKVRNLQLRQMKHKDNRVKIINEILSGMKVLKLLAWEASFQEQVMRIREEEMKATRLAAYLNAFIYFLCTCAPFLVAISSFAAYVLMDDENYLDPARAFVSLSLLYIISQPLSFLPTLIPNFTQGIVSISRLSKYLSMEEVDAYAVSHDPFEVDPVVVDNGSFSWGEDEIVLKNINLRVKQGSLVAVVGTVGSGKSSLLSAILGEMDKLSGRVNTKGSIGYVPQQAWCQNATVRENILFGKDFDYSTYNKVIQGCALKHDLDVIPGGDQAEIGEKGINLSGGQKQRISLARAVYSRSEILLMDDPLSAVDAQVGKQIFNEVIGPRGMLREKTRIFVTHGVNYLSQVDDIIVLNNGIIIEQGTYKQLLNKKGHFADFLNQHKNDTEECPSNPVEEIDSLSNSFYGSQSSVYHRKSETPNQNHNLKESQMDEKHKIIEDEKAETSSVKMSIYINYFQKAGFFMTFGTFFFYLSYQVFAVSGNLWLSEWSGEPLVNGTIPPDVRNKYLWIYGGLGVAQTFSLFLAIIALAIGTLKSASIFHSEMLHKIMRCPMFFFDITPLGRIVNRFAKDIDVADNMLPQNIRLWLNSFFQVLATLFVISYSTPIFLSIIVPIAVPYFIIQRFFISTSRQLKRLESISRSPIYSHFGETVSGAATIRAYGEQARFVKESERRVDLNQRCYYPLFVSNRWLAIRLEILGNVVVFFAALFAVLGRESLNPGLVGLSISYALQVTQALNYLVRYSCDVETNIVAVERLQEYMDPPQEAPWEIPERKPKAGWPEEGVVIFDKFQSRYRDGLDLVLKNVTFRIEGGEKIGVVGRTHAGKSSLSLGLFQILKAAGGSITIDGVSIAQVGLHDVRGRITIIPQEPVLFSGTLRRNLDPFENFLDAEIYAALELAHLTPTIQNLAGGLEYEIAEGGDNFSMGQKQLVCLARALLRKTKILVLDEATASVDLETDDLIQETIRREFKDSTVLTIAHRLNTIMDSNRVLVMNDGQVKEFDSVENLLRDENSTFFAMVKDAGLNTGISKGQ